MAVKQKVVECVDPNVEARLQLILRCLQNITASGGLPDKSCSQIVVLLGKVHIPSDPVKYMEFITHIKGVQDVLAKKCSNQDLIFVTLKALYDEISDPNKNLSPAMSIVLQLMNKEVIPTAVRYILNTGYQEQSLQRALYTLCIWLTKWTWTENLGPLVLAFMRGLEVEQHYEILLEVTLATVEQLFKLLILPASRPSVGPVVLYMLSSVQHSPEAFFKIIPHANVVVQNLDKEKSESSHRYLQEILNLCKALTEHFPEHSDRYDPVKQLFKSYYPTTNYKQILNCKSWTDGVNALIPSRCSIGKVGLNNLGNTCYMNSVLQALFMTKMFRNDVLLHNKEMASLFSKLQVLFALLQHSKKFSLSPSDILNLSRPPGFLPGHQHDSSEFLGYLLDTLHEQERNVMGPSDASGGDSDMSSGTIVQQSFGGRTVTVSRCGRCGTESERLDDFRELQLSFPSNSDNQSVKTLLDYYMQPEKLSDDNQYHCDICGGLTDGERVTRVVEAPPRLILTLKHFRYDPTSQQRTKLLQRVQLDSHMCLEGAYYELYAAVVHCGSSVDSGHYYTFAKDGQDWFKFNDCSVMKAMAEDLCNVKPPETPYILFYSRRDCLEPENLPDAVLSPRLQSILSKDTLDYESERRKKPVKVYNTRQNRNDEPPPPGCGGGGFGNTTNNMFVC